MLNVHRNYEFKKRLSSAGTVFCGLSPDNRPIVEKLPNEPLNCKNSLVAYTYRI